jgi:hypothetical protein
MSKDLFLCQIYVEDIIFVSTNKYFYDEFSKIMTDGFEIFMMGVLTFFLGFQIKQVKEGTFVRIDGPRGGELCFLFIFKTLMQNLNKFNLHNFRGPNSPNTS